jgi:succinyl-CoA synthetase beta subunit
MARLHEYQGKAILAANGFQIPRGRIASTADELWQRQTNWAAKS